MKRWITLLLGVLFGCCVCTAFAQETEESTLQADAQAVLSAFAAGDYAGIVARFDETMAQAVDAVALEAAWNSVTAQIGPMTGVSAAQTDEASRTIALMLAHESGSAVLVIVFGEDGRIAGMSISPQSAAAQPIVRELPLGVEARAVKLFAQTERELAAELLIPADADKNTPYVILAHGSGPSDMDETIGANKPFRDLAYDLAALGVGSLRFDKLTYAQPQWPVETVEQEYLEPVAQALAVLRSETGAQRVYLIGHSEGGMLAPYLVAACGFDGGVALAGTPRQLWEISYAQNLALLEALPEEQKHEVLYMQVEAEREKALRLAEMTDEEATQTTVFGVSAVYLRHLAQMDQAQIALESGKPFLFLWGEADFQVDQAAFAAWQERLGGDARFSYKTYPSLNHLFMPAGADDSILNAQAAYQEPKLMDEQVARDIAAWISAQ